MVATNVGDDASADVPDGAIPGGMDRAWGPSIFVDA